MQMVNILIFHFIGITRDNDDNIWVSDTVGNLLYKYKYDKNDP